jgi:transketolase
MATDTLDRDEIVRLAALATGDEKHEASSYSTLDALMVLYGRILHFDPTDPQLEERDRFILSKGHGPAAFYGVLCHHGFFPESWLPGFMRQGGRLGGHPDRLLVPGVEASTGSLGHGLALAVGVALALRAKDSASRVVVLTGDAELNEGSNWEAIIAAPHLGLTNLTLLVIDNGSSTPPMRPIADRLSPFGWDAEEVDGRDHGSLERSLSRRPGRPSATIARIAGEPR